MYLVFTKIDGESQPPELMNAKQIFDHMDMEDCFPFSYEMELYLVIGYGTPPIPCKFYGTWHDLRNPLWMEIRRLDDGSVVDGCLGTDH